MKHNESRIPMPKSKDHIRDWLIEHEDKSVEDLSRLTGLSIRKLYKWMIINDIVKIDDKELFCAWYKYRKYSIIEMAAILRVTSRSIYYYMNKYGLREKDYESFKHVKNRHKRTAEIDFDRSILYDKEKLAAAYEKHGCKVLARGTGVSVTRIRQKLKKFGIETKSDRKSRPTIKYEKKDLIENYIDNGVSSGEYARQNGVDTLTVRNWLAKLGVKARNSSEAGMAFAYPEYSKAFTHISRDLEG
jgi:transposase-like protein